ncbi:hypothetical protein BC827DRAFT_1270230 [Russula dissimulans]|nr:hypothetical protein BC827DRAFT_1270230 [Russula dissimulans]
MRTRYPPLLNFDLLKCSTGTCNLAKRTSSSLLIPAGYASTPLLCALLLQTLKTSTALSDDIKGFIVVALPAAIDRGPFIAGAESEVDDFHVAAWLVRIAYVVGAQKSDEGVSALERRFRPIPHKIKVFWGT